MVQDVNFDRNGSKNLVLLPAIGENPLFDDVLDDEFRLWKERMGSARHAEQTI